MTPDELMARCKQFISVNSAHGRIVLTDGFNARLESLCREMIAVGLERAELEYHRYKAGRPSTSNTTYAQWLAAEAQRVKEGKS